MNWRWICGMTFGTVREFAAHAKDTNNCAWSTGAELRQKLTPILMDGKARRRSVEFWR
jgi:hypothetical protein